MNTKQLTNTEIQALPEDEALLYLAHRDKVKMMNRMYDRKFDCGPLINNDTGDQQCHSMKIK